MKKSNLTLLIILCASFFSSPGFATTGSPNPCNEIQKACEAAGYRRGGHQPRKNIKRGLFRDCMKKILKGDTVKGVRISADRIVACKERKIPFGHR